MTNRSSDSPSIPTMKDLRRIVVKVSSRTHRRLITTLLRRRRRLSSSSKVEPLGLQTTKSLSELSNQLPCLLCNSRILLLLLLALSRLTCRKLINPVNNLWKRPRIVEICHRSDPIPFRVHSLP